MAVDYQAVGNNAQAPFTLKVHRGEGAALLAMDWRTGEPPDAFVGFAIRYQPPGGGHFSTVYNRLNFEGAPNPHGYATFPTTAAPIQKFRWVVFPQTAPVVGPFTFRVTAMMMDGAGMLSEGATQEATIDLGHETYPGLINIAFTRGYVASQAFVDRFGGAAAIPQLLPAKADDGLGFVATHAKAAEAYAWMGFEARQEIDALLADAIASATAVSVVAYDLNLPDIVEPLKHLGARLRIIIDDNNDDHGEPTSAETQAATALAAAGAQVKRQHMGQLQHNKMIVVEGPKPRALCGSTNFSWRGFYVQSNNAVLLSGAAAIAPLKAAFEAYWTKTGFADGAAPDWHDLALPGVAAKISFSPHDAARARLAEIAADIGAAQSSLLYSLAFLYMTSGPVTDAVTAATQSDLFTYGISDKRTGIVVHKPDGNLAPVYFARLAKNVPPPFKPEPFSGRGANLHHKFVVIDFDTDDARVWCGSYNFSPTADTKNGENLLLIRDRKIATAYMVEGIRIVDAYHFRVAQDEAKKKAAAGTGTSGLALRKPPGPGEQPWWREDYSDPVKIRDRKLFA